jgi:hypothetical protein
MIATIPENISLDVRCLAQQLMSMEADCAVDPNASCHAAVRVCEKLRVSVIRFAGVEAFAALLRRTIFLARAENPALKHVAFKSELSIARI